jgi:alpha-beta hydrolase superfamily lysophospholipase
MSITYSNSTFLSSEGHTRIVYARWLNESEAPRLIFVIAHGMAEYIDRYDDFARFLAGKGFVVYGNDHLGHGKTSPRAEDRGYFAETNGRYCLRDDMQKLVAIARKENEKPRDQPELPLVFMGHSMGSFIARFYCMSYSKDIDAAIFMGTSMRNPLGGIGAFLAGAGCILFGKKHHSPFFEKIVSGAYAAQIPQAKTPKDWLNSDEAEVAAYLADKNAGFMFTMEGYRELITMLNEINVKGWTSHIRKDLPILVTSGSDDPVGSKSKGVHRVYEDLRNAGIKDVTLKIYPGMRHEILHEPKHAEVYQNILTWCTERCLSK